MSHHRTTPRKQIEDLRIKLNRMREHKGREDEHHNGPPPDPVNNLLRDPIRDRDYNKTQYSHPHHYRGKHPDSRRGGGKYYESHRNVENKLTTKEAVLSKREWDEGKPKNIKIEVKTDTGDRHYSLDENDTFSNGPTCVLKGTRGAPRPRSYDNANNAGMSRGRGHFRARGRGRFFRGGRGGGNRGRYYHKSNNKGEDNKEGDKDGNADGNVAACEGGVADQHDLDHHEDHEEYYEEGVEYYELNEAYVEGENVVAGDNNSDKKEEPAAAAAPEPNKELPVKEEKQEDTKPKSDEKV